MVSLFLLFFSQTLFLLNSLDVKKFYTNIKKCENITASGGVCDGSKEFPFPDLIFALTSIDLYEQADNTTIQLFITEKYHDLSQTKTYIKSKENLSFFDFFQKKSNIDVQIIGAVEEGEEIENSKDVEVLFGVLNINFILNAGQILLENIKFRSNLSEVWMYLGDTNSYVWRGGFIEVLKVNSSVVIRNCQFLQIYLTAKLSISNIVHASYSESVLGTFLKLELRNVLFSACNVQRSYFHIRGQPGGGYGYNSSSIIILQNITVEKLNNLISNKFINYPDGLDKACFLLFVKNSKVSLTDLKIRDSMRLILAEENNIVSIANTSVILSVVLKTPELLLFLTNNQILINNLSFNGFNDPQQRDSTFMDESFKAISMQD